MPAPIIDLSRSPQARLQPTAVDAVRLTDAFWAPRIEVNRTVTIPSQRAHCEATGRIDNFRRASGRKQCDFVGIFFNDSDIYKWAEAASWSLAAHPDETLDADLDAVIDEIAAAQQADGYLNTYYMFDRAAARFSNLRDMHEIYCAGHLFQAAVAHYRATGKRSLLDVACRLADHFDAVFGDAPGKRPGACGHPEAEMGLVELFRITDDCRYLALAKHMIDARGRQPAVCGGGNYWQDHKPFIQSDAVTGHAVRQLYLNAGAADVVLETGEVGYAVALDRMWENFTQRRMYVTGGAGARWEGEAFGADYELPNERAYAETCAAIASVLWNARELARTRSTKYADLLEWTLYNAILPGLSLDGTRYFYQNPLADRGKHRRQEWFGCACCPPNIARLLAQLPGYVYATAGREIFVHLYADSTAALGNTTVVQRTNYPWDGEIEITVKGDAERLWLRIPGWATGATVNGAPAEPGPFAVALSGGQTTIRLSLPMRVRRLASHPHVTSNHGRVALTRGPLVYCLEQADHGDADVWDIALPPSSALTPAWRSDLLGGVVTLTGEGVATPARGRPLYAPPTDVPARPVALTAVPYYAWANRDPGPMQVWIPVS